MAADAVRNLCRISVKRGTHSSVCTGGAVVTGGAAAGVVVTGVVVTGVAVTGGAAGRGAGAAVLASPPDVATRVSFWARAAAGLVPTAPTASARAPRTRSFDACRRCRGGPDRSIPQERAIEGPAA